EKGSGGVYRGGPGFSLGLGGSSGESHYLVADRFDRGAAPRTADGDFSGRGRTGTGPISSQEDSGGRGGSRCGGSARGDESAYAAGAGRFAQGASRASLTERENRRSSGRDRVHGESGIRGFGSDGQRDGKPAARKGPQRNGIQPDAFEGGMADQERHEMGGYAQGGRSSERHHVVDGDQLCGTGGGDERSGWHAGRRQARQDFCGSEHGGAGVQPGDCRKGERKGRGHGGLAGFWKRDHAAGRQAIGDGGRAERNVREGEAVAAGYWAQGHACRRERASAGDEDWREFEPGGANAGVLRGSAAGRKERHQAGDGRGGADAQRDRVADGAVPRAVRAENAERGLVQRQHDAE